MKSFITLTCLAALIFTSASCNKEDNSSNSCPVTPPSWIQGTWADVTGTTKWTFTANNAVAQTIGAGNDFCAVHAQPQYDVVELVESGSSYSFQNKAAGGSFQSTYSFERVSATKIYFCSSDLPCEDNFPFSSRIELTKK